MSVLDPFPKSGEKENDNWLEEQKGQELGAKKTNSGSSAMTLPGYGEGTEHRDSSTHNRLRTREPGLAFLWEMFHMNGMSSNEYRHMSNTLKS